MYEYDPQTPPIPQEAPRSPDHKLRRVITLMACTLSAVGLAMQFQSVSLLTGAGILWIGAALAAVGFVATFATKVSIVLKVATALILVACVANVVYVEHQLNEKRHEIQQILNDLPS